MKSVEWWKKERENFLRRTTGGRGTGGIETNEKPTSRVTRAESKQY